MTGEKKGSWKFSVTFALPVLELKSVLLRFLCVSKGVVDFDVEGVLVVVLLAID